MDESFAAKRDKIKYIFENPIVFGENRHGCLVCNKKTAFDKNFLNLETHFKGKCHLKNLKKLEAVLKGEEFIIYTNLSRLSRDDLVKYFSQFGTIIGCRVSENRSEKSMIMFETEDSFIKVFQNGNVHYVNGVNVKAFPGHLTYCPNSKQGTKKRLLEKKLLFNLAKQNDIFEEIKYLKPSVCLSFEDQESVSIFSEKLSAIVTRVFPESQILPYGSSTLSLPLKTSDIDFTILLNHSSKPLKILRKIVYFPMLLSISSNIYLLRSKKQPLIKMWSRDLKIDIDVSLNNYLALRNNELIRSYLTLSGNVDISEYSTLESMIFIIKLWRQQNMVSGNPSIHINSYGWILMIIYYLQRIKYFPSLQKPDSAEIRDGVSVEDQVDQSKIGAWDCSFIKDVNIFKIPEQTPDLMQTIKNFFRFYSSEFDYFNHVVDIRHGGARLVTRDSCLEELKPNLNIEDNEYLKIINKFGAPFVVQDPFDLSHNVTKNLTQSCLENVLVLMGKTLNRLENQDPGLKNDAIIHRDSLFEVLLPCEAATPRDPRYHQIGIKYSGNMTMESFVERGVCSLFSILFIKFTSTVKVRVGKTPSEPLEITDAILKEKLFTNFDLDEFEEMTFEIVTPGHPWLHGITSEASHTDEGAEVVSALYVEYQITFYYHILNQMLKIRFQPNLKTDQEAFNNLFSLIEKELKRVESNGLDVD